MTSEQTAPFDIESLLGSKLLTKVGAPTKSTKTLMKGKELVALYFSASWCPPCKTFSPVLADFYNACAKDGKLEIVYISSDRTVPDFEGYYSKMPWLSIPTEQGSAAIKSNLAESVGITGIPTLVVVDVKTGEFVTAKARDEVTKVGGDATKGKELIEQWKAMERQPLSEARNQLGPSGGLQGPLLRVIKYFAKNPMYIFGLLYLYKWATKQWNAMSSGDEPAETPMIPQEAEAEF
jgi:nucleoredoxin